jgi:adenine-specific DNA-methyltransferase
MNTDLLTEDLKKKRASNESFWLIGQPDVGIRRISTGPDTGKWEVQVQGFDYYNPKTGAIESGDTSRVAMWMLDTCIHVKCSSRWLEIKRDGQSLQRT